MLTVDAVHEMFAAILARLDAIDQRLAGRRNVAGRVENCEDVTALIQCIARHAGEYSFAVADLLDGTLPGAAKAELREAMVRAVGDESSRRVGQLLRRLEGATVGGYRIARDGNVRGGILWALVPDCKLQR